MSVVEYVFRKFPCTRFGVYGIVLQRELYMYLNACREASHTLRIYYQMVLHTAGMGGSWVHIQSVFFVVEVAKLECHLEFL